MLQAIAQIQAHDSVLGVLETKAGFIILLKNDTEKNQIQAIVARHGLTARYGSNPTPCCTPFQPAAWEGDKEVAQ